MFRWIRSTARSSKYFSSPVWWKRPWPASSSLQWQPPGRKWPTSWSGSSILSWWGWSPPLSWLGWGPAPSVRGEGSTALTKTWGERSRRKRPASPWGETSLWTIQSFRSSRPWPAFISPIRRQWSFVGWPWSTSREGFSPSVIGRWGSLSSSPWRYWSTPASDFSGWLFSTWVTSWPWRICPFRWCRSPSIWSRWGGISLQ